MRLHVLSDLHHEFEEIDVPDVPCDVVILAGDIATKRNGIRWIKRRFTNPEIPVIYLCGNHEYYGEKLPKLQQLIREEAADFPHIHFLENDSVTINGIHFFGSSLWTNFDLQGGSWQVAADLAGEGMNDYRRITSSRDGNYHKLRPVDTRRVHLESMMAMENFFADPTHTAGNTVIITHHAPSRLSLPDHRKHLAISAAYASSLDDFILNRQPQLWIHGHIHHSNDYQIGSTRVISNPRAYPDDPNPNFNPALVIEVHLTAKE